MMWKPGDVLRFKLWTQTTYQEFGLQVGVRSKNGEEALDFEDGRVG